MLTAKEKLNKAFDSSADSSTLVHLSQEEASAFVDSIVDQSTIFKAARVIKMDRAKMEIGKLIGNGRFLHAGGKNVAVSEGDKDKFGTGSITLITKELIGAIDIYDSEKKHNIEGQSIEQRIMSLVAKKVANELEEIALYSDTAGTWGATESAFSLTNGWLKNMKANGNVIDAAVGFSDAKISKEKLVKLIKSMPTKFRKDNKVFAHDNMIIDYNSLFDASYNKNTLTDNVLGTPIVAVPNMRFDANGKTDIVIANPMNLIVGIQVEDASMSFEKERNAALRKTTYHYCIEVDFAVEEALATAVLKNVTALN